MASTKITVKFTRPPMAYGYAYHTGDVAEFEKALATELIENGYAEEVKAHKKKTTKK